MCIETIKRQSAQPIEKLKCKEWNEFAWSYIVLQKYFVKRVLTSQTLDAERVNNEKKKEKLQTQHHQTIQLLYTTGIHIILHVIKKVKKNKKTIKWLSNIWNFKSG